MVTTKVDEIYKWNVIFNSSNNYFYISKFNYLGDISPDYKSGLFILELIQIVCSFLMWFFFICKRAPLVIESAREYIVKIETADSNTENYTQKQKSNKTFYFIRNLLIYIKYLGFDPYIVYYMIYTGCAILGMFNSLFIALLLLDIFLRYPLILHVFKSIWRPKKQILMTIVLFFICQYYFTIIAFYYLYDTFGGWCDSLYGCFSVIFDQSYKVYNHIVIIFLI